MDWAAILAFALGGFLVVALWWVVLEVQWRRALAADAQARRDERAADVVWMDRIERRARADVEQLLNRS